MRELFGDRVDALELTRTTYVERSPGDAHDYVAFFQEAFGPLVALRGLLGADRERLAALDRDFREFAERANSAAEGEHAEYDYEYLLVVART